MATASARGGGGGGSPEPVRWRQVVKGLLPILNYLTNYM
jgi:hypothetical protein